MSPPPYRLRRECISSLQYTARLPLDCHHINGDLAGLWGRGRRPFLKVQTTRPKPSPPEKSRNSANTAPRNSCCRRGIATREV